MSSPNAQNISVKKFFDENGKIVIPRYQRDYSWEKENIEQFIADINSNDYGYYIGNLIVIRDANGSKQIVDGQQRLISICLLFGYFIQNYGRDDLGHKILKMSIERNNFEGNKIFEFLAEKKEVGEDVVSNLLANSNEYRIYLRIKEILKEQKETLGKRKEILEEQKFEEEFLNKLLNTQFVVVTFLDEETSAHEMFVNLNTKGKELANTEVLKCHLFKHLLSENENVDMYKDNWEDMLNKFSNANSKKSDTKYDDYFNYYFDLKFPESQRKLSKILPEINNMEIAKDIFNSFSNYTCDKCLYTSFLGVVNHNLELFLNDDKYDSLQHTSKIAIADRWKYFRLIKFKQLDVLMAAIFYADEKKKSKKIAECYTYLLSFLKFMSMHQVLMSIKKVSPSVYGNVFMETARKIFSGEDIKDSLVTLLSNKPFISQFKMEDEVEKAIKELKCERKGFSDKSVRNAKIIHQLLDDDYNIDMKAEHFICQSSSEENYKFFIGNIILVTKDNFGNKTVEEKLKLYDKAKGDEKFIKKFLAYGIDENNYKERIEKITNYIASRFAEEFIELKRKLSDNSDL